MPRSSRSVSLVLLGSAAFLAGCSRPQPQPREEQVARSSEGVDWEAPNDEEPSQHSGGTGTHGSTGYRRAPIFVPIPVPLGGGSRGGGGVTTGPRPGGSSGGSAPGGVHSNPGGTSRGGFGSMGHSATS